MKAIKIILPAILFGGAVLFPYIALTEESATAKARAEVKAAIEKQNRILATGTADDYVNQMYGDDLAMVGGGPGVHRGKAALVGPLREWWASMGPGGTKGCHLTPQEPAVVSPTTYASFLALHCNANPPYAAKPDDIIEMYVWKKTPRGWKVVLEMWAEGAF